MTGAEIAEWIGLNIAAVVVLFVPNWWDVLPDMERWMEVVLKFAVMLTVIGVNTYKMMESYENRRAKKKRQQ